MAADMASLLADISFWETWGYVALGAVVIGVIGESIEEFTEWPEFMGIEKPLKRLSALVLILGLAGEGVTQPNTNAANAKAVAFANKETAQLALDLEKERAKTQARFLSENEFNAIAGLKGKISSVSLAYASNCIECEIYFNQVYFAFLTGNVDVNVLISQSTLGAWRGLMVEYPDFPADNVVANALGKVGLLAGTSKLLPETTRMLPGAPMDRPLLLIGERSPEVGPDAAKILFKPIPAQ
jgi:hypothetical protein